VCDKIIEFTRLRLPVTPLANFLTRLLANPSNRSVEQLYVFIERHKLPVDEEGFVYCWKAVDFNLRDKHTGTISNHIGAVVQMPRNQISDDPSEGCHRGLHCGNFNYVRGFGSGDDRYIMVKVDPANVVCIPYDSSYEKMRVCEYEVIEEVSRDKVQAKSDDRFITTFDDSDDASGEDWGDTSDEDWDNASDQ